METDRVQHQLHNIASVYNFSLILCLVNNQHCTSCFFVMFMISLGTKNWIPFILRSNSRWESKCNIGKQEVFFPLCKLWLEMYYYIICGSWINSITKPWISCADIVGTILKWFYMRVNWLRKYQPFNLKAKIRLNIFI